MVQSSKSLKGVVNVSVNFDEVCAASDSGLNSPHQEGLTNGPWHGELAHIQIKIIHLTENTILHSSES